MLLCFSDLCRGLPRNLPGDPGLFYGGFNEAGRSKVWQHDLPEIPELDNLFSPQVCMYSIF